MTDFYVRAMGSCSDEFIEAYSNKELYARRTYERWCGEFDYVELWADGKQIVSSYDGGIGAGAFGLVAAEMRGPS